MFSISLQLNVKVSHVYTLSKYVRTDEIEPLALVLTFMRFQLQETILANILVYTYNGKRQIDMLKSLT